MHNAADSWSLYVPDAAAPWDIRRVVHLHRRAGFAATWPEIQRDLRDGPQASIDRVLAGKARSSSVNDFEATAALLADAAVSANDPGRLKAWWIYRMLFGPDALSERLTLLWHDHFATSNLKVSNLGAMLRQNQAFRRYARAPFGELLTASVREPALLVWLDAPANRKGHPNENLARELMELFTLGIGHFSESDVKGAARALTGWTVEDGEFHNNSAARDDAAKSLFGRSGHWTGDDLVKMLLDHPATAERLAWRLCGMFLGEKAIAPPAVASLAAELRNHNLNIGRGVATILRSRAFFADSNIGTRIAAPVEWVVGSSQALELADPPPSTLALADWVARLGQDLFYPPNVGGWAGGRSWINTRSTIGRANFAAALLAGPGVGRPEPLDVHALIQRHGRGRDRDDTIAFLGTLLRGAPPAADERERMNAALQTVQPPIEFARRAAALLLAAPEGQVA